MRPTTTLLLILSLVALSPAGADGATAISTPSVAASATASSLPSVAASATKTDPPAAEVAAALPPATLPDPELVPLGAPPAAPTSGAPGGGAETEDGPSEAAAAEPEAAPDIVEQSAELEAVRQAEQKVQAPARPNAPSAAGLGLESPLRGRLDEAHARDVQPPADRDDSRIPLLPELDHGLARLQAEFDIPIEVNEDVVAYIRFFQTEPVRGHFVKWLGRAHRYMERYREILREEGVPEDTVFLAMIESGFGNFAYSRAKAVGPWQFIAQTGRLWGLKQDFWVDERRDPERSAHAAARFLNSMYQSTNDWRLAWAGYNAGLGRINKAKALGYDDFWSMAATPGRKVLRAETKGYVPKLMAAAIITKHPEAFGFKASEIQPESWTTYDEVTIPHATLISVLARAAGVPERSLVELNPELRRACTPPRPFKLKIPKTAADTFAENWPELSRTAHTTFAAHVVRRGDTLARIASAYGVPVQGIREMNGIPAGRRLRVGQELVIPRPMGAAAVARAEPEREDSTRRPEPARPPHAKAAKAAAPVEARAEAMGEAKAKTTLRVQAGDTLWSISQKMGVRVADLCRWNGIKNPRRHKLLVGVQLVVFGERG